MQTHLFCKRPERNWFLWNVTKLNWGKGTDIGSAVLVEKDWNHLSTSLWLSPLPGGTAMSHGQLCQMLKRCRMKRMDVSSPHYQNEVIHQCHCGGFICVLACTQVALWLLRLVKVGSLNSCMTYFLLQAEPSLKNHIYTSVNICQPDKKLSKMLT